QRTPVRHRPDFSASDKGVPRCIFRLTDNGHFSKLTPVSAAGDNSVTQRDKRVFIQFPSYTLYMKIFRTGVITLDSCHF
ncbi:TPA: hypothetical protein ACXGIY_005361, partial [Klebsiella pneumoniae]